MNLFSQNSNLYDHDASVSQTDGQTDGQTTGHGNAVTSQQPACLRRGNGDVGDVAEISTGTSRVCRVFVTGKSSLNRQYLLAKAHRRRLWFYAEMHDRLTVRQQLT